MFLKKLYVTSHYILRNQAAWLLEEKNKDMKNELDYDLNLELTELTSELCLNASSECPGDEWGEM